jgi:hypothetical protein
MRRIAALVIALSLLGLVADPARAAGDWSWPVTGPVIRGFEPPASPFGAGHRGIDIAAPAGTPVRAPAPGTVSFAGPVAGSLFLTIDHGFGLSSTYSWVSELVVGVGVAVARGQTVALSGGCHPGDAVACLHFGVRLNGAYVDPLAYLAPIDVGAMIRLAPLEPGNGLAAATAGISRWGFLQLGQRAGASWLPGPVPLPNPWWSPSRMSGLGRTPLPRRGRARSPWAAGARHRRVGGRGVRRSGWSARPERGGMDPVPG